MRYIPVLRPALMVALLAPDLASAGASQETSLRTTHTVDDVSGRSDTRVIILSDSLPLLPHTASPDEYKGATIIIACGNRVPADSGRSLMLFAAQPLEVFGAELGVAELRTDSEPRPRKIDLAVVDYGDAVVIPTGGRSTRQVAFLGTDNRPYYSESILRALMAASAVQIRYRVIGGDWRTASFHPTGLRQTLQSVPGCRWPD